ncbi:MAG: macro domain-containing protein [Candidatus Jordarchaeales archaeon]|nr:macro domain-containing protein [Candidatus Jordarchaeia archaeon]
MNYEYKNLRIETYLGDITKLEVDAIVNAANSHLWMGGGVAGAIRRAGGVEIEEDARRRAPKNERGEPFVPVGQAVASTAGRLKAKYVIHAPTMEEPGMITTPRKVEMAMEAALRCAEELEVESIAVPALGTGVGGVPKDEAAKRMVKALFRHVDSGTKLKKVILCDVSEEQVRAFDEALSTVKL